MFLAFVVIVLLNDYTVRSIKPINSNFRCFFIGNPYCKRIIGSNNKNNTEMKSQGSKDNILRYLCLTDIIHEDDRHTLITKVADDFFNFNSLTDSQLTEFHSNIHSNLSRSLQDTSVNKEFLLQLENRRPTNHQMLIINGREVNSRDLLKIRV